MVIKARESYTDAESAEWRMTFMSKDYGRKSEGKMEEIYELSM
jgi:hypothetical protein